MAKITIVGCGNSGCAHAAILSLLGHQVTLFKTSHNIHDENFEKINAQHGIYYIDSTNNGSKEKIFQPLYCITRNINEAFVDNTDYVFVLTQSLQHKKIAELICPKIQNIKLLIIVPGNLGSVFFRERLNPNVIIAEGESTVIDARIEAPGIVRILFRNVRNALSFNPAYKEQDGYKLVEALGLKYTHNRTNVIETALHNPNLIVHTIGAIMSAARIEYSKGEFWLYKEGFTPSIWKIINALDEEKNNVIKAYGGMPCSYVECCKFRNEESEEINALQAFMNYAESGGPKGPATVNSRYITEDVPNGLCLLSSLGEKAQIATPTANALITLASIMLGEDFRSNGRTLENLGWQNKSVDEIIDLIT